MRQHYYVAARDLGRLGPHAFGEKALTVRLYGAVVLGDDVPAGLRFPSGACDFCPEEVWSRDALGRPNQLLFLRGQVACEGINAFLKQPDTSVGNFDVRENVCLRILGRLRVGGLIGVRCKCGDVDEAGNAIVSSGARDDASSIRVADENSRTADSPERLFDGSDVVCGGVEAVLGSNALVPFGLKSWDHLAEA